MTSLALQALLLRVEAEPAAEEASTAIKKAVVYLLEAQDPKSGLFGSRENWSFVVGHALATQGLALYCRDSKRSGSQQPEEELDALKKAVQFIEDARNPYAGWRYEVPSIGDNDSRITGYMLLALAAAAEADVYAAPKTFAMGMTYLAEREDPSTGRTRYMEGTEFALRIIGFQESHPAERAEAPTAMHMRLLNDPGFKDIRPDDQSRAAELLLASAPLWDQQHGTIDYTYWWQGTAALASLKDSPDAWECWRLNLRNALIETQVQSGPLRGTWPTVDAWSAPGMEIYTTATCALALLIDANTN